LGDAVVDGRIILKRIIRKWDVGGMDWIELGQDRDRGGHFYCSNEPSCSVI